MDSRSPSPIAPPPGRLSFLEKLGYGLGDTASNFVFHPINLFLVYYYTDVFGLLPGAVSVLFLVVRILDTINDPFMGAIADRTRSRWGKYRPYLLWIAAPFGLLAYATFASPPLDGGAKLVYAYVTFTALIMVYTAINVPYSALLGVMSPSSAERTSLSSYRFVCAFTGQLLIGFCVRPLVRFFGGGDEARGFAITMAVFAGVAVVLFLFTFCVTRERVQPPPQQRPDLKHELGLLFRNRAWCVLAIAALFTFANIAVRNAVAVHYFKYYMGDDGSPFVGFMDRTTLFFTSGAIALILGVACTKPLARRWDKRTLVVALSFVNALGMLAMFVLPPDAYWTAIAINAAGTFAAGPTAALVWAMFADVADYGAWKFGRRTTALAFSALQFAQGTGLTLGGFIPGQVLETVGFVANTAQTTTALTGIRLLFAVIPGAFALGSVVVMAFYPLRDAEVARIERELAERAAGAGQPESNAPATPVRA